MFDTISGKIKAVFENHDLAKRVLLSVGALHKGIDHQIDTYFVVPKGSLKLRESTLEGFLVYCNPQKSEEEDTILLHKVNPNSALKNILTEVLTPLVTVYKSRDIYHIDRVIFNLDDVKYLGKFAVIDIRDDQNVLSYNDICKKLDYYTDLLGILPKDFVVDSYGQLLLRQASS